MILNMSYIIAFVQFAKQKDVYPVECFRTDIDVGDVVLVHMPNRRITPATVMEVRYLSWQCSGQIKGKLSEAVQDKDGYWSFHNCPSVFGFATNEIFVDELKRRGWVPLKRGNVHMAALTNSNRTLSANILVRRNGIDLQILPTRRSALPRPFTVSQEGISLGRVVRHYFANTNFNLYEGILRFSDSFMAEEDNYDRFFKSVGSSDRRTEKQKQDAQKRRWSRSEDEVNGFRDYYEMVSDGSGEPVYGGDGMWIDSGGSLYDEG